MSAGRSLKGADDERWLEFKLAFAAADDDDNDPFAVAVNQPFTFVWWPDPLLSSLGGSAVPPLSNNARANYSNMAGRTSFFFVLPAFPSL